MKYKVLLISLLSTLAIPYGITSEGDRCGRDAGKGNPQREATEEEIAKYQEEAQRIAEEESACCQDVIELVKFNLRVGGMETVDLDRKFQTLTEAANIQATTLENSLDNLTTTLADIPGTDLFTKVTHLTQEINKDKATNEALRREIDARKREQAETNALLHDVIQQHHSSVRQLFLPPEAQPLSDPMPPSDIQPPVISPVLTTEGPTNSLSAYQQELLSRKNQIGDEAWKLLGGENKSLAAALLSSIQQNPGTMIEILFLGKQNFTLCINGEDQYYPYDF